MFKFKSYKDDELEALQNSDLLARGEYEFKVLEVKEKISNNGNEMLVVKLQLSSGNEIRVMTDWLVMTDKMAFKFKHFCEALGLGSSYEKGEINLDDFKNRQGKLFLDVQPGNPKQDGSGNFPSRNAVKDYIKTEMAPQLVDAFEDKDIPF